jgi:hypothetical protein
MADERMQKAVAAVCARHRRLAEAGHVMREVPLERRRDLPLDVSALA